MMSSTIKMSNKAGGKGVIKATTIASTATGTVSSPKLGMLNLLTTLLTGGAAIT
jgi:hypothetical protein